MTKQLCAALGVPNDSQEHYPLCGSQELEDAAIGLLTLTIWR